MGCALGPIFLPRLSHPLQCDLVESDCAQGEAPDGAEDLFPQPEVERTTVAIVCAGEPPATDRVALRRRAGLVHPSPVGPGTAAQLPVMRHRMLAIPLLRQPR